VPQRNAKHGVKSRPNRPTLDCQRNRTLENRVVLLDLMRTAVGDRLGTFGDGESALYAAWGRVQPLKNALEVGV
jgi:hypothetical protein